MGVSVLVDVKVGVIVGVNVVVGVRVIVGVNVIVGNGVMVDVDVGMEVGSQPRLSIALIDARQRQQKRMTAPRMMRVSLRRSGAKSQVMPRMGKAKSEDR